MIVEEGDEAVLELLLRDIAADGACLEQPSDRGRPRAPRVARDEGIEGGRAREAADLGLVRRALEVVGLQDRGEVEQGAGGARHPDALVDTDLVSRQSRLVDLEARPRAHGAPHGDLDAIALPHPPERTGGAVAQHRALDREDRGEPDTGALGNLRVDGMKSTKGAHIACFVDFVCHGAIVAPEV